MVKLSHVLFLLLKEDVTNVFLMKMAMILEKPQMFVVNHMMFALKRFIIIIQQSKLK